MTEIIHHAASRVVKCIERNATTARNMLTLTVAVRCCSKQKKYLTFRLCSVEICVIQYETVRRGLSDADGATLSAGDTD